jgi:anti-anti-sigma factor
MTPGRDGDSDAAVVRLSGEIDLFNVVGIQAELFVLGREGGSRSLVLDLTDVTFIDLTALRVLAAAARRFDDAVFRNPPKMAERVLALTRLDDLVLVQPRAS